MWGRGKANILMPNESGDLGKTTKVLVREKPSQRIVEHNNTTPFDTE